jgi:alpha-tubulin suppressor-like RCC1 family protein
LLAQVDFSISTLHLKGRWHSIFITSFHRVFASGYNGSKQLSASISETVHPKEIISLRDKIITRACGGFGFSIFHSERSGLLFGVGSNGNGQIGVEEREVHVPTIIPLTHVRLCETGAHHTLIVNYKEEIFAMGCNAAGECGVGLEQSSVLIPTKLTAKCLQGCVVKHIACGYQHTIILSDTGKVFAAGINSNGCCGLGHSQNGNI